VPSMTRDGHDLLGGWNWARLGAVCRVPGGPSRDCGTDEYWADDIVWVTPTDLGGLQAVRARSQ
jgi:hypothetical protein